MNDSLSAHERNEIVIQAKSGDSQAIATLLAMYGNYLSMLARVHVDMNLRSKADPSDLVQETFLQATRNLPTFRGSTEEEFVAWLRGILANTGVAMIRKYRGTQARDLQRERRFEQAIDRSSVALGRLLTANTPTPSQIASRRENAVVLADALHELPSEYREVLVLHHLEGLPIQEVATRIGRTVAAVKGLRTRAIVKLRGILKESLP